MTPWNRRELILWFESKAVNRNGRAIDRILSSCFLKICGLIPLGTRVLLRLLFSLREPL